MLYIILYILFLLEYGLFASAQDEDVPNCALSCINIITTSYGCENWKTANCTCNVSELLGQMGECSSGDCTSLEQNRTSKVLEDMCAAAGVDLRASSTPTLSTTAITSQPTSATSSTPHTVTAAISPGSASPSMSTGAVAGLSIGATLGVVLLVLGAYLFWRRRKRISKQKTTSEPYAFIGGKAEMEAPVTESKIYYEMDGTGTTEIEGTGKSNELEDRHGAQIAREREDRSEMTG